MQVIRDPAITLFGKKIRFPTTEKETESDKNSQRTPVDSNSGSDEDVPPDTASESGNVMPRTPSVEEETAKKPASEENENEKSLLKKPDKIIPCPRCSSMDTKFCYYNNYNVNQPRHFCKACQRYWTAGGTMRNVPVGAGRRKNKHYRHLTVSDALRADQIDSGVGADGVLSFGFDSSAAASAKPSTGDECSSASNSAETVPCIPGVPWPSYPPFCPPPGFPMPFYPYWPSPGAVPGGAWNMPWLTAPPPIYGPTNSESPSPGKRAREGETFGPEAESPSGRRHGGVLVPKTLRFDDPSEAAKSSIWATLGIENGGAGTFRAFRSTSELEKKAKSSAVEPSLALRANPAAMCRSVNFHETS